MKRFLFFFLLVIFYRSSLGQSLEKEFTLNILPDNGWILKFSKDHSYRYYHWNGWGGEHTLDSGYYKLKKNKIILSSVYQEASQDSSIPQLFYIKKPFLKNEPHIRSRKIEEKKFLFYKKTYILFTEKEWQESLMH